MGELQHYYISPGCQHGFPGFFFYQPQKTRVLCHLVELRTNFNHTPLEGCCLLISEVQWATPSKNLQSAISKYFHPNIYCSGWTFGKVMSIWCLYERVVWEFQLDHRPADTNAVEWKLKNKDRNTSTVGECTFKPNTWQTCMDGISITYSYMTCTSTE